MLVADLSMAGDFEEIYKILSEVISQPDYNRLGAVLLLQKHFFIREVKIEYKIIINKGSINKIPNPFLNLITDYFDNNSTLLTMPVKGVGLYTTNRQNYL